MARKLLIAAAITLGVADCGGGSTHATSAASTTVRQSTPIAGLPSGSRLLLDVPEPPSRGYAADGSLYIATTTPVGEHVGESYEMTRVNPVAGRVVATHRFNSELDSTLLARGSLWVTTNSGNQTLLWRLNPSSLAVRSKLSLPGSADAEGIMGSLVAAGGHLWVGAGKLDRVSFVTGRVDRIVIPRYHGPVQLASDSTGNVLLASMGYEHPTYIARLNPESGGIVSQVTIPRSLTQPTLAGVIGDGAWVENTVGSKTTAWHVNLGTLTPTNASRWATVSSRISLQVLNGRLWVTQPLGADNLNYCANPVTGRPLARLPLLAGDSVFLAADATDIYYTDVPLNAHAVRLESAPISPGCVG